MPEKQSPQQLNAMARMLIQMQGVEMRQQIYNTTVVPANVGNVVNVIPRNVGLIKGFWIKIVATIANATGSTVTPTNFGPANILQTIQFTDLQNNVRIQTTGWHLNFVNSIKSRRPYAAAHTNASTDSPVGYGANWTVSAQTASIATANSGTVTFWYWVPLAYSDSDYRGAVYANVVNATMQMQLTLSNTISLASGDTTNYLYTGGTGATISSATITVYQVYMDQIPMSGGVPILPMLDLSTIYELKNTTFTSMVANSDFPMQYSNFRDFLSTFVVYYNGTTRGVGADINYWALQSANFTNIWKNEPALSALRTRQHLGFDMPIGVYYFGSREKPITTVQYGNMELVLNAATAAAGSYALVGYEDFALVNMLSGAGSLPAGA